MYSGVVAQLGVLGADHVGYAAKCFEAACGTRFSVVGGRPFSKACSERGVVPAGIVLKALA